MPLTPLPSPRVPLSGQAAAGRRRRRTWWIAGSAALHLMALAAVLMVRRPAPDLPMAPSYELLFDNGGASVPPTSEQAAMDSAPPSQPADAAPDTRAAPPPPPSAPPEPQQLAMAPSEPPAPVPDALPPEPPPPPLPDPTPEPLVPPPQAQAILEPTPQIPMQQAMAPPLAPPAPPDAAPPDAAVTVEPAPPVVPVPTPAPPAVRLAQPDALAPSMTPRDLVPDLAPPAAPPPLPPLAPRPAPPRPQFGSLGAPMDLNFGQVASRAPAPRGSPGSRAVDFSLGAPKPGPNKSEAFFDIRARNIGADWAQGLTTYWRRHRYYPQQAAENGEDGTVQVVLVVNRLGRVQSVEVKSRSGSPWLDMAAVAVWRNAQLAPLPAENTDPTITIPLTINYILLR